MCCDVFDCRQHVYSGKVQTHTVQKKEMYEQHTIVIVINSFPPVKTCLYLHSRNHVNKNFLRQTIR